VASIFGARTNDSMGRLGEWSLAIIASTLLVKMGLELTVPRVVLHTNRDRYDRLVVACERARESEREVRARSFEDDSQKVRFLKSIHVDLLVCAERAELRNTLLEWGVRETQIRSIELHALVREPNLSAQGLVDSSIN